jgi:TniQ
MTSTRLLIQLVPDREESLRGFITRVAEQNKSETYFRASLDSLQAASKFASQLAELSNVDRNELEAMLCVQNTGSISRASVRIGEHHLEPWATWSLTRRVCPECLQTKSVSKVSWELKLSTGCGKHGRELLDRCNVCNRVLRWGSGSVGRCLCGNELSTATTARLHPSTAEWNLLLERALYGPAVYPREPPEPGLEHRRRLSFEWLHLLKEIIVHVLIPRDLANHSISVREIPDEIADQIVLEMLNDEEYVFELRSIAFLHAASDPLTQNMVLRPGKGVTQLMHHFAKVLKRVPKHPAMAWLSRYDLRQLDDVEARVMQRYRSMRVARAYMWHRSRITLRRKFVHDTYSASSD